MASRAKLTYWNVNLLQKGGGKNFTLLTEKPQLPVGSHGLSAIPHNNSFIIVRKSELTDYEESVWRPASSSLDGIMVFSIQNH